MANLTVTGDKNLWASLTRVAANAWFGAPVSGIAKMPDLLSGESIQAVNAAGTGLINLIGVDANNNISVGGGVGGGFISTSKTIANAGTNLFTVALPAGASFGCLLQWTIQVTDGTDMQAFTGVTTIAAVNKAGVYTSTVTELAGIQAKAVSAGTLTEAITIVTGANLITVKVTPTTSLTPTGFTISYLLINNSTQVVTLV